MPNSEKRPDKHRSYSFRDPQVDVLWRLMQKGNIGASEAARRAVDVCGLIEGLLADGGQIDHTNGDGQTTSLNALIEHILR